MMKRSARWCVAAVSVAVLGLTGCAGTATASGEDNGVKTDYGVAAGTINLGVLQALTGPNAVQSAATLAGIQIYFDERNASNPICGFQVALNVQDNAYDVQKVQQQYNAISPDILAIVSLNGSPQQAALSEQITNDQIPTTVQGWSSASLANEYFVMVGTTYPVSMIDGLTYLMEEGAIKDGDTIGHLYLAGAMGEDGLVGSDYFAEQHDLDVVKIELNNQEADLSSQAEQLKAAGVSAIALTTTPKSTGQLAAALQAAGLDVPLVGNTPSFDPTLVADGSPVADYLVENFLLATSNAPYDASSDIAKKFDELKASGEIAEATLPTMEVNYGYAQAYVIGEALDAACEAGDLTRAGVLSGLGTLDQVSTGAVIDLDYTDRTKSPSTATFILKPAPGTVGSMELVTTVDAEEAKAFNNR